MKDNRKMEIVDVSSATAAEWLKTNVRNRRLRDGLVKLYAEAMRKGEWKLTSEPVMFSDSYTDPVTKKKYGTTLMEGQHRLNAVIASGCTVKMTVVHHCDPEEFAVIGQGRKRTPGDVLGLINRELEHPQVIASVCSGFLSRCMGVTGSIETWQMRRLLKHFSPEVSAVVKYRVKLRRMATKEVCAALMLAQIIQPRTTTQIAEKLYSGIGFAENDPIRRLFQYLHHDLLVRVGRDTPETVFYKTCNGLHKALVKEETERLGFAAAGLAWLRNAAKPRLEPVMAEFFAKSPSSFYSPEDRGNYRRLARTVKVA